MMLHTPPASHASQGSGEPSNSPLDPQGRGGGGGMHDGRRPHPPFIDTLPPLRGRVQADAPLAPFTWFRVGGPAEVLVRPADEADLARFLRALPPTFRCTRSAPART